MMESESSHIDPLITQQQSLMNSSATMLEPQQPGLRFMNSRDKLLMYQLNQYYSVKSIARSKNISKTIQEVVKIVHDVLRELEIQEPRFISTFTETNGHYEGNIIWYEVLSVIKKNRHNMIISINK